MDKYIEVFCKQNPKKELVCLNEECKCKFTVSTKEIFSTDAYKHTCEKCEKMSTYQFRTDFVKQLKAMGIKVK